MQQAKNLATTFTRDPQMQLPYKPRMSEDFVKLWHNRQTLVVLGGLGEVVLRGKSVGTLLPHLLPLLSGRWTVPEIIERVPGVRPGAIEDTLYLLYTQGVLEEGYVQDVRLSREQIKAFETQLKFYSRYVDHTRVSRSRYEILNRLQASSMVVLGSGLSARRTFHELLTLGLGHVTVVPLDGEDQHWLEIQQPHARIDVQPCDVASLSAGRLPDWLAELVVGKDLLLLATDRPFPSLTRRLNRLALDRHVTFMRSYLSPAVVEIGPAVFPQQSSCYECAHLLELISLDEAGADPQEQASRAEYLTPEEQIGASQTALAILAILTKFLPIKTGNTLHRLSFDTLEMEVHAVHSLPGCPACSPARHYEQGRNLRVSSTHAENWPVLYHFNTNERTYSLFPKGHQVHYAPKNTKTLGGSYKTYRNRAPIPVQPASHSLPENMAHPFIDQIRANQPPRRPDTPVTIGDLTLLLQLVAGRYSYDTQSGWQIGFRVTPSAGALASQTLYLANFAAEGLPIGLYHFNPHGALETLHQQHIRGQLDRAVFGAEELPETVIAAIIQTSAFGRIESKYQAKSYRYALYDGGVMLHSLQVVSHLMGLDLWQATNFYDDEVSASLGIHSPTEFPVYVAYLVQPKQ